MKLIDLRQPIRTQQINNFGFFAVIRFFVCVNKAKIIILLRSDWLLAMN